MRRSIVGMLVLSVAAVGCDRSVAPGLLPPENVSYLLDVSGDPENPSGLLLRWDPVEHPELGLYRVYSRPDQASSFGLRASTTSTTFHDRGQPHLEYYVVAVDLDGRETEPSEIVLIDERLRLEAPDWIASTSLNGALHVAWSDNPFANEPNGFSKYHIYSSTFSLDDGLCGEIWVREGTTVAPEFVVSALPNGQPRCLGVSAESIEGWESLWSPIRSDTPRPDARNLLVTVHESDPTTSGFRFWLDANGDGQVGTVELGVVADGNRSDMDFRIERDAGGPVYLTPIRTNTVIQTYGTGPIADLTSIDIAPETGFTRTRQEAKPRWGYVFQMTAGDAFARFGAVRMTHVGQNYVIFDWSYQTDPGNPELSVGGVTGER